MPKKAEKKSATNADKKTSKKKKEGISKKHGRKYFEAKKKIEPGKEYSLIDAITLAKDTSPAKFDATVEVHIRLGIDPAKADQQIRNTVALPHGTGKTVRVIAFCDEAQAKEAKSAGAIEAGADKLIEKITGGWLDFDVAVATPDMMRQLGKIAKTLGTRGLMPNPKAGTVTPDPVKTIKELLKGRIEYRNDSYGIVHSLIGKTSFDAQKLLENAQALFKALGESRPSSSKKAYILSATLTTTMGPGIKLINSEVK